MALRHSRAGARGPEEDLDTELPNDPTAGQQRGGLGRNPNSWGVPASRGASWQTYGNPVKPGAVPLMTRFLQAFHPDQVPAREVTPGQDFSDGPDADAARAQETAQKGVQPAGDLAGGRRQGTNTRLAPVPGATQGTTLDQQAQKPLPFGQPASSNWQATLAQWGEQRRAQEEARAVARAESAPDTNLASERQRALLRSPTAARLVAEGNTSIDVSPEQSGGLGATTGVEWGNLKPVGPGSQEVAPGITVDPNNPAMARFLSAPTANALAKANARQIVSSIQSPTNPYLNVTDTVDKNGENPETVYGIPGGQEVPGMLAGGKYSVYDTTPFSELRARTEAAAAAAPDNAVDEGQFLQARNRNQTDIATLEATTKNLRADRARSGWLNQQRKIQEALRQVRAGGSVTDLSNGLSAEMNRRGF